MSSENYVTENIKCLHIQPPLMVRYASIYGYSIMSYKPFNTSDYEMGISPDTILYCLGLKIIGGIYYKKIEKGVDIGEGM